ncbi:hypothetical protein K1719_001665 [Acacia pycnantha]|nr:hypothetical protein K1719_001665 [Acacia pycnantha]
MDRLGKIKRVLKAATHVHRQLLPPSDLVQNKVCTDEEEKSKLERKRAHSPEAEDIDDTTPWGCKTGLSLSLYDYQNPVCTDKEEKYILKRKRAHSPKAEDIDDIRPWGCKTGLSLSLYDDQNPVCTDKEEKYILKRKRAHSPEAEDIDDTTPWGCKTGLSLSLYDDLNPVCTDKEEKYILKRNRAHSPEAEDIDDTTPWGCKTGLSLYDDPWKIKKVLTGTDVQGHHNRLLLPYDLAESLVCPVLTDEEKSKLDSGEGTEIKFCDVNDNMSVHSLLLKMWPSSGSYVLIRNWTGDFVKRRELKKGDEIGLQWDKFNHRFNFSVLRSFSRSSVPVKLSGLDSANMD